MEKRIKSEDDIMLIIFGVLIGIPIGMVIITLIKLFIQKNHLYLFVL